MKKNVIKTAIAAVCVVAAGVSGMKAYNAANQSEADMLLSENVEALSQGDGLGSGICSTFCWPCPYETCTFNWGPATVVCNHWI